MQDIKAGSTLVSILYKTLFRECITADPEPAQVIMELCSRENLGQLHLGLASRVLRHLANSTSEWRPYLEARFLHRSRPLISMLVSVCSSASSKLCLKQKR